MKKKYVAILLEFSQFRNDVVLVSTFGGENYIEGDGNGIGSIGDL